MTEAHERPPMNRIVDSSVDRERGLILLHYVDREGCPAETIAFPLHDAAIIADMCALAVRAQLASTDPKHESASITSFSLAEMRGAETVLICFRRGSQPSVDVAVPKPIAHRLRHALEKALPMIGGPASVN